MAQSFFDKCEEYFQSRDFYEILKIKKDANEKELKKAYHRLSLKVHPDRVEESKKLEANEKFKVLGKIHRVLQDAQQREVYDESGTIEEEDNDSTFNWRNYWQNMFKKLTTKDIENYEMEYMGSEAELRDIKKAYIASKGNIDLMYETVPFLKLDTEERMVGIVRKLVDDGELEEYDVFFNEPKSKKDKRRKKMEREQKEAEKIQNDTDLQNEIKKNREKRESSFFNLLDTLESKYSNKGTKRKAIKSTEPKGKGKKKRVSKN
ncbi:PREDICTED: J domain-containing protein CG6693-like [Nicrophorus vespilloides]|uniref:J domain-containing protein CG6693-like n=1 Tax=Nicrophorus vespilloides TaxID=110193 RepID=A0ABM1M0M5_NICVS|nr:PREDICTED: J domain-containing protein CG6693-like [Nicrophorus vespilloides]